MPPAPTPEFVTYALAQMDAAGEITCRAMFGGHTVYCGGKVVGLICDDQLFVKPTDAGRAYLGEGAAMAPAYPGAKPSFLIGAEIEDAEWLAELIRRTEAELPRPKPKPRKKRAGTP